MKKKITVYSLLCLFLLAVLQSCYKENIIAVEAKFTTAFKQGDQSVPVYIELSNLSQGADSYQWEFEGGTPNSSTLKNPENVLYTKPGIYTIRLIAKNVDGEQGVYEQKVDIKDAITVSFTKEIVDSNYPPVEVKFINQTKGVGFTYHWQFEGGTPAESKDQDPGNVVFQAPGVHKVSLTVSNGYESFTQTDQIEVKENIAVDFDWEPALADYDYQAPVKLYLKNKTDFAIKYTWNFEGTDIKTSTLENPVINFSKAGTYTISLLASNGKVVKELKKQVTIVENTGLYFLNDVKLGINYSHNSGTIGAFYSTRLRQSFTSKEVTPEIAPLIDIVYHGQDNSFSYNKFVSPTQITQFGFSAIIGAKATTFVNSQEICNCGLNFTQADFQAMQTDAPLKKLTIVNSVAAQQQFNSNLPRVVLFETATGKKGAIHIKKFVKNSPQDSYILCDIKVQR